jgi:hypothetical protein
MKLQNINCGYALAALLIIALNFSCKKQQDAYLNIKANNSDITPTTLSDFQALLDKDEVMNDNYPVAGLASSDNFYIPNNKWPVVNAFTQSLYIWGTDIWHNPEALEWNYPYELIEYANVVLDGLKSISQNTSNQAAYNNAKGTALFFRAFAFYNLSSEFCKPYTASSASVDLGIPLRLTSDPNAASVRATVQQTYDQIVSDLKLAISLLPETQIKITRPTSIAANALLAKVYLSMEDYSNALTYANATLNKKNDLIDYNNTSLVNPASTKPFPAVPGNNPEIIFYATSNTYLTIFPNAISRGNVDSLLIRSYQVNDNRLSVLFASNGVGTYRFKGTYDEYSGHNFCGLATNEIYLIRAECNARANNITSALSDLNTLLSKRFATNTFIPLNTNNEDTALVWVLKERRKELPFTSNVRWEDLRRLNKDPRFAVTLKRIVLGVTYTLPPNDPKYVLPIPDKEIQLTGIQQNPR